MSFATFATGWPFADTMVTAYQVLQARNEAYLRLGYGIRLRRDYYLIIPERKSAVQLFGGYEQFSSTIPDSETRELRRAYIRFGLD